MTKSSPDNPVNDVVLQLQPGQRRSSDSAPWAAVSLAGAFLVAVCSSLMPSLLDWQHEHSERVRGGNRIAAKGRSLLAEYGFHKAMDYYHSGALPTMFDEVKSADLDAVKQKYKRGSDIPDDHWVKLSPDFGPPLDFVDRFGRYFHPTRHTHLSDGGSVAHGENRVREILPWYWLTAALDPHDIESYLEAAYWLRKSGGNAIEAAAFLREGLQANPDSYELLYELGRIYEEDWNDVVHARNLWEIALQRWEKRNQELKIPDEFPYRQITGRLARLEDRQGNTQQTLQYLEKLKRFSTDTQSINDWIDDVQHHLPYSTRGPHNREKTTIK